MVKKGYYSYRYYAGGQYILFYLIVRSREDLKYILNTGINCAFEIFRKTVLQTVSAAKRFASILFFLAFYESAIYGGGKYDLQTVQISRPVNKKQVFLSAGKNCRFSHLFSRYRIATFGIAAFLHSDENLIQIVF